MKFVITVNVTNGLPNGLKKSHFNKHLASIAPQVDYQSELILQNY